MTRQQTLRRRIEALLADHEQRVISSFLASVRDLTSNVQMELFVARFRNRDIEGALRALNIDRAAFRALDDAILAAYTAGGVATIETLPILRDPEGARILVRFDARATRAEREIAENAARLVVGITREQEQSLRDVIERGLREGRNPRSVGRDIAGRVSRATGKRTGGIIGLTAQRMETVTSARSGLLSGDPERMRSYLGLKLRDRGPFGSFDKAVEVAIREGRPVKAETVERMMISLSNRYLMRRGETIARSETLSALNKAQVEAWKQVGDAGGVRVDQLEKTWRSARDSRVREAHRHMNGETVPFLSAFSNGMQHPGDPAGGAANNINCRCVLTTQVAR